MMDMGTNTLDTEVRPHRDGARTITMDANIQTSIPIVDVMLPCSRGDHLSIPQVNLSISGYEPDPLRHSHRRTSSRWVKKFQLCHNWMGQHLFQQEILLEEEHRKTPD